MPDELPPARAIIGPALVLEVGLGVLAVAAGWLLGIKPLAAIVWSAADLGYGLLATVPMLAALWAMTRWPVGPLRALDALVRELVVPLFRGCTTLDLLLVSVAAGFGEELLFRGLVQAGIERASGSPWLAIVLGGLVFGLAHPISTTYAVLAGLIGIYLGWLFMASGNLLTPLVAHAAYDFIALCYLLSGSSQRSPNVGEPHAGDV